MTNVSGDFVKIDFAKIVRHSEDNYILSLKNLLKRNQEKILSRPLRERRNFLANANELRNFREGFVWSTPSPKFLTFAIKAKNLAQVEILPSHRERGRDSVIQNNK